VIGASSAWAGTKAPTLSWRTIVTTRGESIVVFRDSEHIGALSNLDVERIIDGCVIPYGM
jgi:hypothetical protein